MSIAICGYHNKPICKECHHCEDCGINACVHTERGRYVRETTRQMLKEKGKLSEEDVKFLQMQFEVWENNKLKQRVKELEEERDLLVSKL